MPIMSRFQPNWESLQQYKIPQWYQDAKFGIFIHWGVYAVPAFGNEWYPRHMYQQGTNEFKHHVETYGPHNQFGYKDFIPLFKAEQFDATQWAALFVESGAKFVMPVAEHHDGFAMYETALNRWNAKEMGPKRDIVGELADACRAQGLVFTLSSHRAEHYWFMDGGMTFDSDVRDPAYADFYGPAQPKPEDQDATDSPEAPSEAWMEDWLVRTIEVTDKYRPQIVWFDWWILHKAWEPYLQRFAAHYYNRADEWGVGVAINYKIEAFPEGTAVFDIERGQLETIRPLFWQTDTSVSKNSWSYVEHQDYKTTTSLLHDLIDIVSKNGALLLNIGPRADGTIPEVEQQMLRDIGAWLHVNGAAIYSTRPWKIFGEGPTKVESGAFTDTKRESFTTQDIRFTTQGDNLYAVALGWPLEPLTIASLGYEAGLLEQEIKSVRALGCDALVEWQQTAQGSLIQPLPQPEGRGLDAACALEISF